MTKTEQQQLLAIAATLEAFASTPHMVEHIAAGLRALVVGAPTRSRGASSEQLELGSEPAHLAPEPAPSGSPQSSPQVGDGSSHTYDAAPLAPSSSSDLKILTTERKKTEPWRPHTDDPIPPDFVTVYDEVVAERAVKLPSAAYLWSKFVEYIWAENKSFAKRANGKRKWRDWVFFERAAPEDAPSASSSTAPSTRPPKPRELPPPPLGEPRRGPLDGESIIGPFMAAGALLRLSLERTEPTDDDRPASRSTGPPMREAWCA